MTLEDKVPTIILPEKVISIIEKGEIKILTLPFKVIQLHVEGKPFLRFGNDKARLTTHAQILKTFLEENKINYKCVHGFDFMEPESKGETYEIVGAGRADFHLDAKILTFYEASRTYKISINKRHLDSIKSHIESTGWEVNVDTN